MPGEKGLESLLKSDNEHGGTLVAMQPKVDKAGACRATKVLC
jgi:hypothetical protein